MSDESYCPRCGSQLAADAPRGLCPKCLIQAGFESQNDPQLASAGAGPADRPTVKSPANAGFEPPAPDQLAPLFPHLDILSLIGKGGMGAVYQARQRSLDRLVALKILPPEIGEDATFAERFTREARALARLTHSHIVSVYEFGQVAGLFYIVMEFVDGVNLRQAIQTSSLKPQDALAIVPQICDALQYAHDEGIVHRDIKPENILVDKRGRVKIADFGLAKLLGPDAAGHLLTGTHQVMGTLRYMAPEQMHASREVDHRADIFSLGVVFYELLTGELPMGRFAPPSKKVEVDVRLDEVVLRALEQAPEQRYQHASELKSDVEVISAVKSTGAQSAASVGQNRPATALGGSDKPPVAAKANTAETPRLSRCALAGAILAAVGMMTLLLSVGLIAPTELRPIDAGRPETNAPVLVMLILTFTAMLGVMSVCGSTICGLVAIGHIKHSAGKLYGLRLAAASALWFPLLVLGGAIFGLTHLICITVWTSWPLADGSLRGDQPMAAYPGIYFMAIDAIAAIAVCFFVGHAIWRAINRSAAVAKPQPRRLWPYAGVLAALIVVAAGSLIFKPRPVPTKLPAPMPTVPHLGTIHSGIGAEFTVPAGQVAVIEVVARQDGVTVPVPNASGYVLAPDDAALPASFLWTRLPGHATAGTQRRPWIVEITTFGGGSTSSRGLELPEALEESVGAMSIGMTLAGNDDDVNWGTRFPDGLPSNGAVGLRVQTRAHGLGLRTAVGVTTTDWQKETTLPGAGAKRSPDPVSDRVSDPDGWTMGADGPQLTGAFGTIVLQLRQNQVAEVNRILQSTYREYLALEAQYTEQQTDEAGHLVTTIKPFPNPLAKLEDRLWSQLDAILNSNQQSIARLNLWLHPRRIRTPMAVSDIVAPSFFGWGGNPAKVEIWKVGTWFHWKVSARAYHAAGNAQDLPAEYRRFWKPAPQFQLKLLGQLLDPVAPIVGLAAQDKHVFVIAGDLDTGMKLRVVDVTDPSHSQVMGAPLPLSSSAWRLAVSGKFLYVLDPPKLRVFDCSDPQALKEVGSCELAEHFLGLTVEGQYAYVTDSKHVRVVDLQNPAEPRQVGLCSVDKARGIAIAGQYAYVACNTDGLKVIDISNPAVPSQISHFSGNAEDVSVVGKFAYVAAGDDAVTMWVADISDPKQPKSIGHFGSWKQNRIAVDGKLAYLAGGDLNVVDISSPERPQSAGKFPNASNLAIVGDRVYIGNDKGLTILQVLQNSN